MYRLYCVLKDREMPPTVHEIAYASAKRKLDGNTEAEYIKKLESTSENIKKAFEDQQARAGVRENHLFIYLRLIRHSMIQQGPWNQEKFEQLLTEWIIACDQPFDEVEKPEFITMLNFTHRSGGPLKIPKREGIKRRVMKMGEETIEGVCDMFKV